MIAPARRHIRLLAVSTLVALGGAVLCLWLTLAFPDFGPPSHSSFSLHIPPQAWLLALLVPIAVALALATCISSLNQSRRAAQPLWTGTFTVILLLLFLGPAYLICSFGVGWSVFPHLIPTLQDFSAGEGAWWFLAACSAAMLVLTAICALLYAWRASSPDAPLQGKS